VSTERIRGDAPARTTAGWWILIVLLLALRVPSLAQPAGGDQGLYLYAAARIADGEVMYRDAWDQKPPGIALLYSLLLRVWPHESIVPGADLVAAAAVAVLLVVLGRRRYTPAIGFGAACLFLLLGDPYLHRLGGIYVRGQTEPFISLAITTGLVLLASHDRRRWQLCAAGLCLAAAFWLKYNALAFALPLAIALWTWRPVAATGRRPFVTDAAWVAAGFALVAVIVLTYFAAHGALLDLRIATLDYNIRYSEETYEGPGGVFRYLFVLPWDRARVDLLWFVGGLGAVLLILRRSWTDSTVVVLGWTAAAVLSIAVNGSRGLPNYLVQADPPLALTAAAGLATLAHSGLMTRAVAGVLLVLGLWRVGAEQPVWGMKLGGIPSLIENVRYDARAFSGRLPRHEYLARFKGQKHDAEENERLTDFIRSRTSPADRVYIFGFSGGTVGWKSGRVSSSRFYWSRPVLIEFEAGRPAFGSQGVLEDLLERPPVLVALQRDEWQSERFFLETPALREWLNAGYVLDHETPMFSVWRRR
jgi:hypothetical protein